jgi:hypothetical protein
MKSLKYSLFLSAASALIFNSSLAAAAAVQAGPNMVAAPVALSKPNAVGEVSPAVVLADPNATPPAMGPSQAVVLTDPDMLKEKGNEISKFIPEKIGLKWKDYGVIKPNNGSDITTHSEALVKAMEEKIRKERIASRSSQDPVAFYVFFKKTEWDNFGITNANGIFNQIAASYDSRTLIFKMNNSKFEKISRSV